MTAVNIVSVSYMAVVHATACVSQLHGSGAYSTVRPPVTLQWCLQYGESVSYNAVVQTVWCVGQVHDSGTCTVSVSYMTVVQAARCVRKLYDSGTCTRSVIFMTLVRSVHQLPDIGEYIMSVNCKTPVH